MIESALSSHTDPNNEHGRLAALLHYEITDTPSEAIFDGLLKLAAAVFNVPIILLTFVDTDHVFFKASIGIGPTKRVDRTNSPFALTICDTTVMVAEDVLQEEWSQIDFINSYGIRFYAGAPLITPDGFLIGTLTVLDKQPRQFTESDRNMLAGFARTAMDQIELRKSSISNLEDAAQVNITLANMQQRLVDLNSELEATNEQLTQTNGQLNKSYDITMLLNKNLKKNEQRLKSFITKAPIAFAILTGRELKIEVANDVVLSVWGKTAAVIGHPLAIALPELQGQPYLDILDQVFLSGQTYVGDTAPVVPCVTTIMILFMNPSVARMEKQSPSLLLPTTLRKGFVRKNVLKRSTSSCRLHWKQVSSVPTI